MPRGRPAPSSRDRKGSPRSRRLCRLPARRGGAEGFDARGGCSTAGGYQLHVEAHLLEVAPCLPDEEGRGLLDSLMAHATQRQFVYTHRWRLHDLVMWDNRCTMHRGTEFEEQRWKRDMQRATVSDIGNTCELVNRRAATSAV